MRKWSFLWKWLAIAYPSKPGAIEYITWKCKQRLKPFYIWELFFSHSCQCWFIALGSGHMRKKRTIVNGTRNVHVAQHIHIYNIIYTIELESSECFAHIYCISYEIDFDCTMLVDGNRVNRQMFKWTNFEFFFGAFCSLKAKICLCVYHPLVRQSHSTIY